MAAILFAQLEAREQIESQRRTIWEFYATQLDAWAASNGVGIPCVPEDCKSSHHLFYLLLPTANDRSGLIEHLKERQVTGVFHYQPLHLSEMGRQFGGAEGDCPVTESVRGGTARSRRS